MVHKVWAEIMELLEKGIPIIVAGGEDYGVPSLHNFYRQNPEKTEQYWQSVNHLGFGLFSGRTESGKFDFEAGGAMRWVEDGDKTVCYSAIGASPEVLADLNYDLVAVIARVREIMGGDQ